MNQAQIDADHRFALELSQYPDRDVEQRYRPSALVTNDIVIGNLVSNTYPDANRYTPANESVVGNNASWMDDWTLARTLQSLEFEMANEIDDEFEDLEEADFHSKEVRASGCKRQLCTLSAFIVLVDIAVFIASCRSEGLAPLSENSMLGPPITVLVRFGAKEAALQVYEKEWWRLLSAIVLHGGVWHLIPNALIQLRVGGYLNLVFGTPMWFMIYFITGIFGNMCSTIFTPEKVGVGASGSILGMLTSWIVWIIFRWKKIPKRFHSQRNCQLGVVVGAVAITLITSFAPYVDWAVHFGGAIQGILWGVLLLSKELDVANTRMFVRFVAFMISFGLIAYASYYIVYYVHPSKELLDYFEYNDDWSRNTRI